MSTTLVTSIAQTPPSTFRFDEAGRVRLPRFGYTADSQNHGGSRVMPNLTELLALSKIFGYDGVANTAAAFRKLTVDEGRQMAVEFMATERQEREIKDFLHRLATFVPGSLVDIQGLLIDRGIYYPGILFHKAPAIVRDRLIHLLDTPHTNPDHLLKALAWVGDDVVVNRFAEWRNTLPAWAKRLHVTPDRYAEEAGWTLTPNGIRRDLFYQTCLPLVAGDQPTAVIDIHETRTDTCAWCGRNLVNLLGIDLALPELGFLGFRGKRLNIPYCIRCSGYCVIASDIDFDGAATWRPENERPSFNGYDGDEWEYESLRWSLGPARRSPFEAHPSLLYRGTSQIGGFPAWEQDSEYPPCPECHQLMTFVAQVAGSDLDEYMEGHTYVFVCANCRTAATVYQQT